MKIAIVTLNPPIFAGGIERAAFYLQKIFSETGIKVEILSCSCFSKDYKGILWDLRRLGAYRLSGRGKTIVSVSKSTAEGVKRYFKLKTHAVIENAVDTDLFKPRVEKNQLRKRFGLPVNQFHG